MDFCVKPRIGRLKGFSEGVEADRKEHSVITFGRNAVNAVVKQDSVKKKSDDTRCVVSPSGS